MMIIKNQSFGLTDKRLPSFKQKPRFLCTFSVFCSLQVIEFIMEVTGGGNSLHIVPISVRMPLLQLWVAAKQMAQQQIPKTLGADDEVCMKTYNLEMCNAPWEIN